jgi:hypothetical protein
MTAARLLDFDNNQPLLLFAQGISSRYSLMIPRLYKHKPGGKEKVPPRKMGIRIAGMKRLMLTTSSPALPTSKTGLV